MEAVNQKHNQQSKGALSHSRVWVKTLKFPSGRPILRGDSLREIQRMRTLRHENIVRLNLVILEPLSVRLVSDYFEAAQSLEVQRRMQQLANVLLIALYRLFPFAELSDGKRRGVERPNDGLACVGSSRRYDLPPQHWSKVPRPFEIHPLPRELQLDLKSYRIRPSKSSTSFCDPWN